MAYEEKTIESKIVYEGPIFNVRKYEVSAFNGKETYRDVVEHNGGAVMLAITDDGKILMEKQFRKPLEREVIELPAGKIDPGEKPEVTAARELKEETGYTAEKIKLLTKIVPSCGYSQETLWIYICKGLVPGEKCWDDTENIDLFEMDADKVIDMIMAGKILDAKTMCGVLYARVAGEI